MMTVQAKEMKALSQKMASLNLNQLMVRILQNPQNCSCHLDGSVNTTAAGPLTINTQVATHPDLNLGAFRSGCDFSSTDNVIAMDGQEIADSGGLKIQSVRVTDILSTGTPNEYSGTLVVDFDRDSAVRGILPLAIDLVFSN